MEPLKLENDLSGFFCGLNCSAEPVTEEDKFGEI